MQSRGDQRGCRGRFVRCLLAILALAPFVRGEVGPGDGDNDRPAGADGTGVYLDDSFEATDVLGRVENLVRAERWREAAELLQTASDRFGDKLFRVSTGYYVGLRRHINRMIAGWPTAGREAYRSLFAREIEEALLEPILSADGRKRIELYHRFFCTKAAVSLADAIAQSAIESGDFALAEYVYARTLAEHPGIQERASYFGAMLAVARALQSTVSPSGTRIGIGVDTAAGRNGSSVPKEPGGIAEAPADPETKIRWKGQDRPIGDVLTEIRERFSRVRSPAEADDWSTFGGAFSRGGTPQCSVDELGAQWSYSFRGDDRDEDLDDESDLTDSDSDGTRAVVVHPVVSGGLVYIQRHREVVALRRNTGEVLWRFRADPADPEPPRYVQDQPPNWDAPTVAGGRLFSSLPGHGSSFYGYGSGQTPHELVCLDAQTGDTVWRLSERSFGARFAEIQFDPSPIVEHDRLYVVGRRRRTFGFEDSYLFRLDARTGRLEWQTHIGSASTGTFGSHAATKSIAAMVGDTVYVCSNLGSVAAVSAYTGAVRWLRLYERGSRASGRSSNRFAADVAPWHFNPVIRTDAGLVLFPIDSPDILVLSPDDGSVLHTIPAERMGQCRTLLGARDGRLCGVGSEVTCFDLEAGEPLWSKPLTDHADVFGRAVWADDRILVPTTKGLAAYDADDGTRTDLPWAPEAGGGNLLALPNQLIVSGADGVTAYVRKSEIWNRLRARLAATPDDPEPALELAEVAMRSGEAAEALDALQQAVLRIGSGPEQDNARVRKRVFKDAISFAGTLADRSDADPAALETLFEVVSEFPTDRGDHLLYRLKFAALFERSDRSARSLELYQQVLQDRSLREMPAEPQRTSSEKAATVCRDRVAELIERHGRSLYESYEREAERLLSAGRAAQDESTISRVVHAFPNSEAAPEALIAWGEVLVGKARPQEAVRLFIQAYHRYPKRVDRPKLLKRIADALEWAGRREDAFRWLTKGAFEYPSLFIEDNGKRLTFLQYRDDRLSDVRDRVEPTRPVIALPLDHEYVQAFEAPLALLDPWFPDDPYGRWSRAYVYSNEQIHALHPSTGGALWDTPAAVRESVDLLLMQDDVAVFATSFEVFGLDPATGKRRWSHGTYPKALDDPAADWEDGEAIRTHALHGNVLATVRDGGTISAIDVSTGALMWSASHKPSPFGPIALNDYWLAYHVVQDGRAVICLVSAASGEWIDAVMTDETRAVDDVSLTLDGRILLITSQSIAAFDPQSRSPQWRVSTIGHVRPGSVSLDVDAVYFSPDGRDLRKVSLDDGRVLWEIIGLVGRGEEDLTVDRHGAQLIVGTSQSLTTVDAVTGMVLWRGTAPKSPRFRERALTRDYVVALDLPEAHADRRNRAFFYDLRNASGVIPADGAPALGDLEDVRRVLVADDAILIQTGPTEVRAITHR